MQPAPEISRPTPIFEVQDLKGKTLSPDLLLGACLKNDSAPAILISSAVLKNG